MCCDPGAANLPGLYPAAVLAGGLAARLGPLAKTVPKSLVDVAGQPFIYRQLRLLKARGIERVVLCVGHLGEMILDAVGDGSAFGLTVEYSFDGERRLGTAGALKRAESLLGDAFFVLYGDSYLDCDYRAVQAAFEAAGRPALMTVYNNDNRHDASNVIFSGGRILAYDKKRPVPEMRHIDYGLGVLTQAALSRVPPGRTADLADLYGELLNAGLLAGFEIGRRFYEIGSFAGLAELSKVMRRKEADHNFRPPSA